MTASMERLKAFGQSLHASDFVRKIAATFVTRIVVFSLRLVTSALVARALGPTERGLFAAASTLTAMGAQFGNAGLHSSNTYLVAQDKGRLPTLIGNSLLVSFGFGGLIVAILGVFFAVRPDLAPVSSLLLVLSLIAIPLSLMSLLLLNLLIGIYEIGPYNTIELATRLVNIALVVGVIVVGLISAEAVVAVGLITLIFGIGWTLRNLGKHLHHPIRLSGSLFKAALGYGIKAYLASLFSFMVLRADMLIVQYMLGPKELGYYSVAVTVIEMIYILPVTVGTMLFPRLAQMSDDTAKWQYTRKIAINVALMMLAISIVAALLGQTAIHIVYGEDFIPAAPAFICLLPGIVLMSVNGIFMNYFASLGMPPVTVYSPFVAMLVNFAANFYLTPRIGIIGTALSSVIAYGLMLVMSLLFIYSRSRQHERVS